ncbi:hypothetical protein HZB00_01620 [Candidatus Woesearchaeota archaeon]|nr:hypothetical protein [Candidatus Woesearchaeota archaeon]
MGKVKLFRIKKSEKRAEFILEKTQDMIPVTQQIVRSSIKNQIKVVELLKKFRVWKRA